MRNRLIVLFFAALMLLSGCHSSAGTPQDKSVRQSSRQFEVAQVKKAPLPDISRAPWVTQPVEHTTYIDPGLIELLGQCLLDGTEYETLKDMPSDQLLTEEEAAERIGPAAYRQWEEGRTEYMLFDADNDGLQEVIVYEYSGGTGGFVSLDIWKPDQSGHYQNTYSDGLFGVMAENGFINYRGKNYFLITLVDYNRKVRTGFEVYSFEQGFFTEWATVEKYAHSHRVERLLEGDETQQELVEQWSRDGRAWYELLLDGDPKRQIGRAETELTEEQIKDLGIEGVRLSGTYAADLDNDGQLEYYQRGVFWPSNYFTRCGLESLVLEDGAWRELSEWGGLPLYSGDKVPQIFCVEPDGDGKTVICALSLKEAELVNGKLDMDSFYVDGYRLTDGTASHVFELLFRAEYAVRTRVYTHGVNVDFTIAPDY